MNSEGCLSMLGASKVGRRASPCFKICYCKKATKGFALINAKNIQQILIFEVLWTNLINLISVVIDDMTPLFSLPSKRQLN